jgi:ADP-ribose pyrophosphatase YjhB (NUDIX family)
MREETNATVIGDPKLRGVYSDPARDPRFHGVTVVVECRVEASDPRPENPIEIREARFFTEAELPDDMAFGMQDILENARREPSPHLE